MKSTGVVSLHAFTDRNDPRMLSKFNHAELFLCVVEQARGTMSAIALAFFKLTGALATAALVADLSYVQFVPCTHENVLHNHTTINDSESLCDNRDLFQTLIPETWDDVVRMATLVICTLTFAAAILEVLCPSTFSRIPWIGRRPAGSLVASTTSAI